MKKILCISLMVILLSGCGFRLRGSVPLPPAFQKVYVKSTASSSPLLSNMRNRLHYSHVQVVDSQSEAQIALAITQERFSTQSTSIGTSSSIRSYQVNYNVQYEIENANGQLLAGPYTVSSEQDVTVLQNEVLENSNKLEQAKTQLMQDVVTKIMFQLSSGGFKSKLQSAVKS